MTSRAGDRTVFPDPGAVSALPGFEGRSLIQHTGWAYFPIAFIARLPFAMMVVGVLTLVASATG